MPQPPGAVRRRKVFYIPGFDPRPARHFREVYRREGGRQAAILGYDLMLLPRPADAGPTEWRVRAVIDGAEVVSDHEVLVWSDLVAIGMAGGIWATYAALGRTAWIYARSGALWPLARLRRGPLLAALYPVLMLLAQAGLALALGWGIGAVIGGAGGAALGALGMVGVLWAFRRADRWLYAHYLMHDFAFSAQAVGAWPPALQARIAAFTTRIRAALESGADEVLVVGHSSGAILAVSAVAPLGGQGRLALLTLGQCIPMMSFLPAATGLRRDLRDLSTAAVTWVDVTAPGDVCAHALCDPVAVSGVAPPDARWPLVISAAFSRTVGAGWPRLRWRFFAVHFQYLCAFEAPEDYDYFSVTAGPLTLGARYADRAPSPATRRTPLSPHRGLG